MVDRKLEDWLSEYEQDSADMLGLLKKIMAVEIKPQEFSIPAGAKLMVPAGQPLPENEEDRTVMAEYLPEIYLQILRGDQQGRKIVVNGTAVIGRSDGVNIVIKDQKLSRRHLQVQPIVGGFKIEDLGSSNGTQVNGQKIHGEVTVTPGDEIMIGDTVLKVAGETFEDHQATQRQSFCTKCGQPLKAGKKFCVSCGAVID